MTNHRGVTEFPEVISQYLQKEIEFGATMGSFNIPPFLNRIGISLISTREKWDSMDRHIILDLSFPRNHSVNDGIDKY